MQVLSLQPSLDAEQRTLKPKTTRLKGWEADTLKNTELSGLAFWDIHTQTAII